MKTTQPALPHITAKIEVVNPTKAQKWLDAMGLNRPAKENSIAMYAADRSVFCLTALLCQWHQQPGAQIFKESNKVLAEKFFRDKQQERFDKVTKLFLVKD